MRGNGYFEVYLYGYAPESVHKRKRIVFIHQICSLLLDIKDHDSGSRVLPQKTRERKDAVAVTSNQDRLADFPDSPSANLHSIVAFFTY